MKKCTKCKETKELSEFYSRKTAKDGRRQPCKQCYKKYEEDNKGRITEYQKKYREENKEAAAEYQRGYRTQNRDQLKDKQAKRERARRKLDPIYRLRRNIKTNIYNALRRGGYYKNSRTFEILGCSYEELQQHLVRSFENNYGISYSEEYDLHIDHIVPISSAKTEEEIIELNHYSNLQYLFAEDNLKKSNKLNYKLGDDI